MRWAPEVDFHIFVESLPIVLQVALLLALGLCEYILSINTLIGYILVALAMLMALRSLWEKIGPHVTAALDSIATAARSLCERLPRLPAFFALRHAWEVVLSRILHVLSLSLVETDPHPHRSSLPTLQPAPQEPPSPLAPCMDCGRIFNANSRRASSA